MDAQPQEIRSLPDPVRELQRACDQSTEVIIATRQFPKADYDWAYSKVVVMIVRARLSAQGRTTEIKTVMDDKSSRIVLEVAPFDVVATKDVHATIAERNTMHLHNSPPGTNH